MLGLLESVTHRSLILSSYLTGSFRSDISLVLIDVMHVILDAMSSDGLQSGKMNALFRFAKFGKIMRIAALFRLPKLVTIYGQVGGVFLFHQKH